MSPGPGPPRAARADYRGAMTRRDASDETPSLEEVEQDFSTPGDADLRPAVDEGGEAMRDEDRP
ncbi:hypothetical protein GCM10025783_06620 [Amnibacterium soli]|uniref:MatE family transporter n=1 Tax=Amnibacterium soli TaxID=1282736 RepID=A0ABP8YU34_9MICO